MRWCGRSGCSTRRGSSPASRRARSPRSPSASRASSTRATWSSSSATTAGSTSRQGSTPSPSRSSRTWTPRFGGRQPPLADRAALAVAVTIAARMVTRRALLGAGLVALAGCGPPDEPEVVTSDVWRDQLRAAQRVVAAYEGVDGAQHLRARARARVKRLEAVAQAGAPPATAAGAQAALAAERAELLAHVNAIDLLGDRASRALLADLVADSAQSEAALLALLGRRPLQTAFPGVASR